MSNVCYKMQQATIVIKLYTTDKKYGICVLIHFVFCSPHKFIKNLIFVPIYVRIVFLCCIICYLSVCCGMEVSSTGWVCRVHLHVTYIALMRVVLYFQKCMSVSADDYLH